MQFQFPIATVLSAGLALSGAAAPKSASAYADAGPTRVVVADFTNSSRDRHMITAQAASQAVESALSKSTAFDVVPRKDLEHAALARGLRPPFNPDDLVPVAQDLGATEVISGEVKEVTASQHGDKRDVVVGLIVRARGVQSEDLVNGAAVRGDVSVSRDAARTDGELLVDAATLAATRAVERMESYKPISGTILSSQLAFGNMVMNRGIGDGVKLHQEFLVYRDGVLMGKVRAGTISDSYTQLIVEDNARGIRPQDQAVSIFPEPKLSR